MDLKKITDPSFLKELDIRQLNQLADDIRKFLINNISKTGGHLSSNLGVVELSIALHYVFESPKDKMVFDVSHQTYPHKMLTGRKDAYLYEEHYDDVTASTIFTDRTIIKVTIRN